MSASCLLLGVLFQFIHFIKPSLKNNQLWVLHPPSNSILYNLINQIHFKKFESKTIECDQIPQSKSQKIKAEKLGHIFKKSP